MYNTGISATLIFNSPISFTGRWRTISPITRNVAVLDDTGLDTTDYMESVPDDLASIDEVDIELYHDGTKQPVFRASGAPAIASITVTFPLQPGQQQPMTITGTGFITQDSTPELTAGQRLIRNIRIKFDGKTFNVNAAQTSS